MPFLAQKHIKTAENRLVLGLFSLFLLFLQSCSPPPVLDELTTFENNRWHMDSAITVQWAPQDAEKPVFMGMYVRHLDDYPYNNLYLFRTIRSSQGVEYSDTVNIALADDLGRWNGTGNEYAENGLRTHRRRCSSLQRRRAVHPVHYSWNARYCTHGDSRRHRKI